MLVDFDSVFHPTEEQKRIYISTYNEALRRHFKEHGKTCYTCDYCEMVNSGHGWMYPRCMKLHKWIEKENYACEHYKFGGFIGGTK